MSLLSVIVPCYNEEESVALFYRELTKNDPFFKEKEIELELLYIDDGSKDGTVREVKKLIEQDPRVHIIAGMNLNLVLQLCLSPEPLTDVIPAALKEARQGMIYGNAVLACPQAEDELF